MMIMNMCDDLMSVHDNWWLAGKCDSYIINDYLFIILIVLQINSNSISYFVIGN